MKLSNFSEVQLAFIVAGATFLGGISSSFLGVFWVDAGTDRQTDVQLVQVAISILSSTEATETNSPEKVLRTWAVDTINSAADVQLNDEARELLISGKVSLVSDIDVIERRLEIIRQLSASRRGIFNFSPLEESEDEAPSP